MVRDHSADFTGPVLPVQPVILALVEREALPGVLSFRVVVVLDLDGAGGGIWVDLRSLWLRRVASDLLRLGHQLLVHDVSCGSRLRRNQLASLRSLATWISLVGLTAVGKSPDVARAERASGAVLTNTSPLAAAMGRSQPAPSSARVPPKSSRTPFQHCAGIRCCSSLMSSRFGCGSEWRSRPCARTGASCAVAASAET